MLSKKSEEFLWRLRTTLMERGKEDSTINEIEDELRDHLMEAEKRGDNIDDITGGSVISYINKISNEMPLDSTYLKFILGIIGFLFIILLMPDFFQGPFTFTIGKLIQFVIVILVSILFWKVIKYIVVHYGSQIDSENKIPLKIYAICLILGVIGMAVFIGSAYIAKTWPIYTLFTLSSVSSMIVGFVIALILLAVTAWFKYWPLFAAIIILTLPELITLIIFQGNVQSQQAKITSAFILFGLIGISIIANFIYIRKNTD
ncbi:hypothetical protein [Staphylococcus carnosus]|uniref:Core-binding (CB) domain-containing protein n=1 Tax=Staphylococcus carnosus TaxID=1281 RepID=A0AAJ0JPZ8_STACA|nr:hypothetical protein [Staphylococcus carnosus]KKB25850.1 hypothetical protein VV61_04620 [Staphylococcus carnosus]POA00951.1 hypothetical protein CD153_08450 [Staphylococcus carnosus]QQS84375.1 hypothetical protein I6J04_08180 [Staphylococcus carnosus]QRQ04315.1 hypothetical protein I6J34_08575 [Staphylococcus carnosus]UTB83684.1 hypothetical protein A2I67_10490 [Staphylococcus carnosus]